MKDSLPFMLIATLFIMPQKWKQPKIHPPINKWNKMWYIHTVDYFSVLLKMEILKISYNMEKSRRYYAESNTTVTKDKYSNMTLKSASKFYRGRKEKGDCQELGEGGMRSYCFSNTETSFWNRVSGLQYEKSSIDWQGWRQIEDN